MGVRITEGDFVATPACFKNKLGRVSPIGVGLTKHWKLYHHGASLHQARNGAAIFENNLRQERVGPGHGGGNAGTPFGVPEAF